MVNANFRTGYMIINQTIRQNKKKYRYGFDFHSGTFE